MIADSTDMTVDDATEKITAIVSANVLDLGRGHHQATNTATAEIVAESVIDRQGTEMTAATEIAVETETGRDTKTTSPDATRDHGRVRLVEMAIHLGEHGRPYREATTTDYPRELGYRWRKWRTYRSRTIRMLL